MTMLITDPGQEERLRAERKASGSDKYDEVWEGVYFMPPMADDEHQNLATGISSVFCYIVEWPKLGSVRAGVNVSDRVEGWEHNFRIPDVAVFLKEGRARNCGTHWFGGPDLAMEIGSPLDRSREKIPFYAQIGVRELWLVERDPWLLELYQVRQKQLIRTGRKTVKLARKLTSSVLPITMRLVIASGRPGIEIVHLKDGQRWVV